ncbi:50S ribosomal protein L10 [Candidatus Sneabacter namystus]|uniref:Large ribosomal subunit protein uL10 n=1 Tax=Candidatus Sneabacter namystus TaxID=2601646 RepID=A0A5C0UIX3_9RICK|nr:50S ribosomal protein L10 [Candidatus Sneabacter namystus]QEK39737.1 50S ribosomal protein L10 [Candidatus Sneabacter namystus]
MKAKKEEIVDEVSSICKEHNSFVILSYSSLDMAKISNIRSTLRKKDNGIKMVKNTLARVAVRNTDLSDVSEYFKGCSAAIAYSSGDPVHFVKDVCDFQKLYSGHLSILGGVIDGQVLSALQVESVAKMPPIEQLYVQFTRSLASPLLELTRVLGAPAKQLVNLLEVYSKNI